MRVFHTSWVYKLIEIERRRSAVDVAGASNVGRQELGCEEAHSVQSSG
jgi:hypothetical protein